jgi:hypothetical protein
MKHRRRTLVRASAVLAITLTATLTGSNATAHHPDHPGEDQISFEELFPGEGVQQDKQHDSLSGHLPPRQENVELIGKAEVTNPSGAGNTGRIADVAAWGNFAYLNAFRDPVCEAGGVHVMDISDPANPFEVTDAFIPTSEGSYAGEGVKVIPIAGMDVLIHQNELCPGSLPAPGASGGINLWDVSDPTNPTNLSMHAGDNTGPDGEDQGFVNDSHSYDVWTNEFTGKTYAALIDNFETTDVDIVDISDPRNPVLINDTLDLIELTEQHEPETLTSVFSHDMDVQRFGNRYIMSLNYWDGGYVLLDVTNPEPGQVVFMGDTDYALLDEERLARGHEIEPEGNAHQSELTPRTGRHLLATDEDFNPFRVFATITGGINAGTEFVAAQASATPPLTEDNTPLTGQPDFVGLACDALPAATSSIALVERGVCPFQVKLDNITAAGYDAGIVFNSGPALPSCLSLVSMLAEGDIPFIFVNRAVGLQILDQDVEGDAACTTPTPPAGSPTAEISVEAVFDGWGYVRLFSTKFSHGAASRGRDGMATITQLDTYAVPESQDPAFGVGFGDLSVHEVAIDPTNTRLAYISYYAAGFRVVKFGNQGIQEVGVFIDDGGNNFWGVEVHEVDGEQVVLASDRDFGLYIFRYTGR